MRADYQTSAIIQTEISGRHKRSFEGGKKKERKKAGNVRKTACMWEERMSCNH